MRRSDVTPRGQKPSLDDKKVSLDHDPPIKIPNLTDEPMLGMTMRQAAELGASPSQGYPGIKSSDVLPEEAQNDPTFIRGIGGGMAINQPALAYKYGVIRNGVRIYPNQLVAPVEKPRFRKETIDSVMKLQEANMEAVKAQDPDEAKASVSTARLESDPDLPKEKVKEAISNMDDLDFHTLSQMMLRDILNNDEQRKIIESRLTPMDITDLLTNDTLTQKVPVIPGKLEFEFEFVSADNNLALKRLIALEAKNLDLNERYLLDKFALMQLTAGVRAINGIMMPDYRNADGSLNDEKFAIRYRKIARLPTFLVASMGINYSWFDMRCRSLCTATELKNG